MTARRTLAGTSLVALIAASALSVASPAAAVELYNKNGTKVDSVFEAGFGAFYDNYNLGFNANRPTGGGFIWGEGYVIGGLKFNQEINPNWSFFGQVTGVGNFDRGDGDPGGSQLGTGGGSQVQDLFAGVKWTDGKEGGASVTFSGGRQKWLLGDGFLINGDVSTYDNNDFEGAALPDGIYNEGGGYYLNPRRVFGSTAIANIETGTPWRGDAFYIQSEKGNNGLRSIAGVNVDYVSKDWGTVGFTYIRGLNQERSEYTIAPSTAASEGVNVYNVHGNVNFGIKDFSLGFNYVNEQSETGSTHCNGNLSFGTRVCTGIDAYAWEITPSYTFSNVVWTPTVYYRYADFSGDDGTSSKYGAYDPIFYGSVGFNTWYIGEIAANYTGPFSSNDNVHSVGLKTAPNIDLGKVGKWTGLSGYVNVYNLNEPSTFTQGAAQSSYFGTELAVYAEFQLFENLYISPLYSVLFTGDAFRETYANAQAANADAISNFQLFGILTY